MDFLRRYFTGHLTPQEEVQVQAWLVEHSEDPLVQEVLFSIMSEMESEDESLSSAAYKIVSKRLGRENAETSLSKNRMSHLWRWVTGVALCLILPLLGAFIHDKVTVPESVDWKEVRVPYGQTDELLLSDGTHLYLNAGTRITYPSAFHGKERKVYIDGEVFAQVVKNPGKPFIISSGDVDVEVFGTTFNFKAYDNTECVELILIDGVVQMSIDASDRMNRLLLHPGDMVQYDRKNGEIEMKEFQPAFYKGFHDGRTIHFFSLRLSDIASDLERLFGVKVVLLDESLTEMRYFAWFSNNETLEQILDGINVDGKMKFCKKDGVIYISRK